MVEDVTSRIESISPTYCTEGLAGGGSRSMIVDHG